MLEERRREVEDLACLKQGRIYLAVMNMEQVKEPLQKFLAEHPEVNFRMLQSSTEDFKSIKLTRK